MSGRLMMPQLDVTPSCDVTKWRHLGKRTLKIGIGIGNIGISGLVQYQQYRYRQPDVWADPFECLRKAVYKRVVSAHPYFSVFNNYWLLIIADTKSSPLVLWVLGTFLSKTHFIAINMQWYPGSVSTQVAPLGLQYSGVFPASADEGRMCQATEPPASCHLSAALALSLLLLERAQALRFAHHPTQEPGPVSLIQEVCSVAALMQLPRT